MKTFKVLITNIPIEKQQDFLEAIYPLIKSGVIKPNNIHSVTESE